MQQSRMFSFKTWLRSEKELHHYLCNLLGIITVQVKFEGDHFPVVSLQLALSNPVSDIRDLWNIQSI